jgi:geranylgeranyl pyrophosphate synthase
VGGLLNGQSLDLHFDTLPHNAQSTVLVARGKTVSLIELTLCLPAILGGASRRELQLLERISNCWGMSYQIVDDLKDLLQSSSESGKTAARDASLNRPNLALAGGVPYAIERLVRLLRAGDRNVETLLSKRSSLAFLREFRAGMDGDLNRVLAGAGISTVEGEA